MRNQASGRRGPCGCFGEAGRSFADRWPLWRNTVLAVMALTVALGRPQSAFWAEAVHLGPLRTGALLLVAALVVGATNAPLGQRPNRHRRARRDLVLATFDGGTTTLGQLLGAKGSTMVLFLSPGCGACRSLLEMFRGHRPVSARLPLVVAAPRSAVAGDEMMSALASASVAVVDVAGWRSSSV